MLAKPQCTCTISVDVYLALVVTLALCMCSNYYSNYKHYKWSNYFIFMETDILESKIESQAQSTE